MSVFSHITHWLEAAMFAPAVLLVVVASVKTILENRRNDDVERESP